MSKTAERLDAAIQYSTTSEPVTFVVESTRVDQVMQVLPEEFQAMYVNAWRDAVAAVMDDCGWTYEAPQAVAPGHVERIRTGRPRVIHGVQIETQLASAVKAVDDALDSSIATKQEVMRSVAEARSANPTAFIWRITERLDSTDDRPHATFELLGSSYIDLTTSPVVVG